MVRVAWALTPLACVALVLVSTLGARPDLPAPLAAAPVRLAAWAAAQLDVHPHQHDVLHLRRAERAMTRDWNSTRSMVLLGRKAMRDFGVYANAFQTNRFIVRYQELGVLTASPESFANIGAVLCHSIFVSNCFTSPGRLADQRRMFSDMREQGEELAYRVLQRGAKINRVAGARQSLTTKDGLCKTLQASGLSSEALWSFTFPCWVTKPASGRATLGPLDPSLLQLLRAPDAEATPAAEGEAAPPVQTPPRRWERWIIKPARGSEGKGIKVVTTAQLLAMPTAQEKRPQAAAQGRGGRPFLQPLLSRFLFQAAQPMVIQPYLASPLLHAGRKWDVRSYVLVTSVRPMRLYLFTEAIVRYASSPYAAASDAEGVVLTNTFVGKKLLGAGVGSITGSLADLCAVYDTQPAAAGEGQCSGLVDAMRLAIGRMFLTAEPRLEREYESGFGRGFSCANCYHLFGVDLIADASRGMHVIEVNVAPDLTLSTSGGCKLQPTKCAGGSSSYDATKRAAAHNTVKLVYADSSAAEDVAALLARHGPALPTRFPRLFTEASAESGGGGGGGAEPTLRPKVLEYLLGAHRELSAAGCFVNVYPSGVHHESFAAHLRQLADGGAWYQNCRPAPNADADCALRAEETRMQMHDLLRLLLVPGRGGDSDGAPSVPPVGSSSPPAPGGSNSSGGGEGDGRPSRASSVRRILPYQSQCTRMLRQATRTPEGGWAERRHIFRDIWDLEM